MQNLFQINSKQKSFEDTHGCLPQRKEELHQMSTMPNYLSQQWPFCNSHVKSPPNHETFSMPTMSQII
jgi:hypothetical protein